MKRRLFLASALALPRVALACGSLPADEVLRGRFVQTRRLQGFSRPLVTEGHFVLSPKYGLIWQAETPFAVTTLMSTAGLVQQMQGAETFRLGSERVPFLARLYTMLGGALAGDWSALSTDFAVTRSGDAGNWQATMTPRMPPSPTMPFRRIDARGGCFVETVELLKPEGDTDTLRFLDQTVSPGPLTAVETATLGALRH